MKIVFVGGGTLGPVTPLLAVAEAMRRMRPGIEIAWIGTPNGPEAALMRQRKIAFSSLPVVKLPRYPSMQWLTFPFNWARVRSQARDLVRRLKPDAIVTAGGFTAVPVVMAAKKLGILCATHQLDLVPGLSNKRIAHLCDSVTTSFEYERAPFGDRVGDETIATPVRFGPQDLRPQTDAAKTFGLHAREPVVLLMGGGTGAQALNESLARTKERWLKFAQVIHVTGTGKGSGNKSTDGYVVRPFLDAEMADAYALADLVVTRAGMGALSEIASLKKPAIVVPIPNSHQEWNASAFEERGSCVVVRQDSPTFDDDLVSAAELLIGDPKERKAMGERANAFFKTDDGTALATRVLRLLGMKGR